MTRVIVAVVIVRGVIATVIIVTVILILDTSVIGTGGLEPVDLSEEITGSAQEAPPAANI